MANEEEDYEDRLDSASRIVQRAYRVRLARQKVKELIRKNYVKLYDKTSDGYFYKNKRTGAVSPEKPVFLGSDDLPEPRKLNSPFNYDPGDDGEEEGYALIVTVNTFPLAPKLEENFPKIHVAADHTLIEDLISHDFLCRIRAENTTSLKNPSKKEFTDVLEQFRLSCSPKSFFILYLCTQVVRVVGADKKYKDEDSYICFPETLWTKPEPIVQSSLSLSALGEYLNKINSERKTVIVNYAHRDPPAKSFFPPKRMLYPASNFCSRLADMCNCAVISSCTVAASAADIYKYTPPLEFIVKDYEQCKKEEIVKEVLEELSRPNTPKTGRHYIDNSLPELDELAKKSKKKSQITGKCNPNFYPYKNSYRAYSVDRTVDNFHVLAKEMEMKFRERWLTEPDAVIKLSPEPDYPEATWQRDENTGFEMKVVLPTEADYEVHDKKMSKWKCKVAFRPMSNFFKRIAMKWKSSTLISPQQVGICLERQTLFCKALVDTLNGGATRADQPVQTVAEVFGCMLKKFKEELSKLPDDPITKKKPNQAPLLFVPSNNPSVIHNPVAYSCGKPVAPERPYIVRVGRNDVTIEWYNPPFDGMNTLKYKVYMKTKSRNFRGWHEVSNPTIFTKYVVQNLPIGIGCQFSVRGWNLAGWSQFSEGSPIVIPGEETKPLPSTVRWKRLTKGGPLAILDRMQKYPYHRFDVFNGMKLLNVFGQKQRGYPKINIAIKATLMALHCLKSFEVDPEMTHLSYNLIGWCFLGCVESFKIKDLLLQNNIADIVNKHLLQYRIDPRIMNSLSFVRWSIPEEIQQPLPMPEEVEEEEEGDDYDSEEEEEAKNEKKKPKHSAAWMSYMLKVDDLGKFE